MRSGLRLLAPTCLVAVLGSLLGPLSDAGLGVTSSTASSGAVPDGADGARSLHSSDGLIGPLAIPVSTRARLAGVVSNETTYRVAPGLHFPTVG